ncbi:glucose PTS transporter subunit IIA [Corynebacterium tapiri]|uniref:PTS beta-glucoside transporter subunit EIIBCA n=1 Tax=Corynebacterium tapiri TaxID=1448266 RepID=A0A5C4U820_9CORY|nr:glucose PTS transporter subunit IIA [Corynebacterium tapiri]TNL99831.1 PTS beta-glucoside transporter subunit EIIBCA [Corynebacterium tapiri]
MATGTTSTAQHILDNLGGPDNITSLTHCATRLRFQVADPTQVDKSALETDPKVLGVMTQGTHGMQVIMGGGVAEYYNAINRLDGMGEERSSSTKAASSSKEYGGVRGRFGWVDYCFEFLSDTFRPVLWALLGASLIITSLVLLDTFGVQDFRAPLEEQPATFQFLHAMWRSVFYFLPIFVGATAARKLGANEWVGAAIPAALFTPEFMGMKETAEVHPTAVEGVNTYVQHVFGLPMVIQDYGGQVFPPIFAAILLFFLEKLLKKIIPSAVQMVFVPFISLLIMIPLTAFVVGPFGIGIGNGITHILSAINGFSPFVLAIVIPLLYPFLVPLGLHWPLNAIMIININTLGYDFIQGPMGAWNFACFGVVTGVLIRSAMERNRPMANVATGGMLAGLLGGISEPSLYGILLRFRMSYARLLPGCVVGGIIMGLFDVKAYAFVFTSLLTIPAMDPWGGYTLGIAAAFFTSMILVLVFDYRTKAERDEVRAKLAAEREAANQAEDDRVEAAAAATAGGAAAAGTAPVARALESGAVTEVPAPLEGRAVELNEVPDEAFASGALGGGVAIDPTGDTVVAPADATVLAVQKTGHAVGLRLDNGIDLLIHVGVDTVKMNGEGFETHVEKKQKVKAGDPLITFDRSAIEAAGYSPLTMVLVSNTKKFASVTPRPADHVGTGVPVISVAAKQEANV